MRFVLAFYNFQALHSSHYTSFVGWISTSASTEYDRVRLVYKLDDCRTRYYVLLDALVLIDPTWLSKALIGHTGQVATCPYGVSKQQSFDKGSAAKVMYNDERSAWERYK